MCGLLLGLGLGLLLTFAETAPVLVLRTQFQAAGHHKVHAHVLQRVSLKRWNWDLRADTFLRCLDSRVASRQRKCPACGLAFAKEDIQTLYWQ
jgi:hypothetical protein